MLENDRKLRSSCVAGDSLRTKIGRSDCTHEQRVLWLVEVAQALGAAHDVGLVHGDVKPDQVIIARDGTAHVRGLEVAGTSGELGNGSAPSPAELTPTASGPTLGSPAYMAPERIGGGAVDARTDQFSWAVMAFELLTGELPWPEMSTALPVAHRILRERPSELAELAPAVPPAVVRVIERALSKDPADRFASMREVALELELGSRPAASGTAGVTGTGESQDVGAAVPRTPPWGILLFAGVVTIGAYWLYEAILTPTPLPPKLMGSAPRGPILGLDDSATRQREAELDAPMYKTPAASASATASSSALVRSSVLGRRCSEEERKSRHCAAESDTWCDAGGTPIACCAHGLASTLEGHCVVARP